MQDQGKRLVVAVALALGVLLLWNQFTHKEEPPPGQAPAGSAPVTSSGKPGIPRIGAPGGSAGGEQPRPPEDVITMKFDSVIATFSSYCGGLKSWRLTDKRYDRDATKGWLLPDRSELTTTAADGKRSPVPADQLANLPACGAFDVDFATASSKYFVKPHTVWRGEKLDNTHVRYTYASPELDVVKTFTVVPETYFVSMSVAVTAHVPQGSEARQQLAVSVYGFQDPAGLKEGSSRVAARVWSSSTMHDGSVVETDVDGVLEWPRFESAIQWTGFEHPYLLVGFAPRLLAGERVEKHTSAAEGGHGLPRGFMRTDLLFPTTTVRPGDGPITREVVGYLGPKNYDDLEKADTAAGFPTGFNSVVDLGWFGFIGHPLLWLLQKLHGVVGNWGLAIILLTFVVKALTIYWTTRSMRSMKAMAALAPQMKSLQAKYADDKQRQQAETMALYKQHNVNPVAGCLPILLQMPIWLALYKMLSNAGEIYQQAFIPGWIDDLSTSDPFYIMPGLLVVTMFVQARLQPAAVDSTQQKFMQYGMPLMFGAFSFVCPAGLTIYMLTNTVLSGLHSLYMNKFDRKSLAIAEQLKQNQAAASSGKPAGAAKLGGAAKPGAAAVKLGKNGAAAKAKPAVKPVIDAIATEVASSEASADDDPTDDEAEASGAGTPSAGPARNRPRRKKRRR